MKPNFTAIVRKKTVFYGFFFFLDRSVLDFSMIKASPMGSIMLFSYSEPFISRVQLWLLFWCSANKFWIITFLIAYNQVRNPFLPTYISGLYMAETHNDLKTTSFFFFFSPCSFCVTCFPAMSCEHWSKRWAAVYFIKTLVVSKWGHDLWAAEFLKSHIA